MMCLAFQFQVEKGTPPLLLTAKDADLPIAWNTVVETIAIVPSTAVKIITAVPKPSAAEGGADLKREVTGSGQPPAKKKKRKSTSKKVLPTAGAAAHMRDNSNASLTRAVTEADTILLQQQAKAAEENLTVPILAGRGVLEQSVPNPLM